MKRLLLCVLLIGLAGCESKEQKALKTEQAAYEFSKNIVKGELIDPSSAQFRSQKGFCGEVNSKNRMGGYVGYKKYMVINANTVIYETPRNVSSKQFNTAWNEFCKKSPTVNKDAKLVAPNYTMPEPVYEKPKYEVINNIIANATPMSPTLGDEYEYIYPVLQLKCEESKNKVTLISQKEAAYDNHDIAFIEIDGGEMLPIKFEGSSLSQDFGSDVTMMKAIKMSSKVKIMFKSTNNGFSIQEYSTKNFRNEIRKHKNDCGWNNF